MMFRRVMTAGLSLTVLTAISAASYGEPVAQPVGGSTYTSPSTPQALNPSLTADQAARLYGKGGPRPGAYLIRTFFSGRNYGRADGCLWVNNSPALLSATEQSYIGGTAGCDGSTIFYLIPHPSDSRTQYFTVRSSDDANGAKIANRGEKRFPNCATRARDVVFGTPRLDYTACTDNPANGWKYAGAPDQRFVLKPVPGAVETYQFMLLSDDDAKCWERSKDGYFAIVMAPCKAINDPIQQFQLRPASAGQWPTGYEDDTLNFQHWYNTDAGWRRSAPVGGVNIPGADYRSIPSTNSADDCLRICIQDTSCMAWTWTAATFRADNARKCWVKTGVPQPINMGPDFSNRIFSGIVSR